jgi:hypothetical protein
MGLFVPLYGPFRVCLKRAVTSAQTRPDTKLFRAVPYLDRAFFFRASGRSMRSGPNVHLYIMVRSWYSTLYTGYQSIVRSVVYA